MKKYKYIIFILLIIFPINVFAYEKSVIDITQTSIEDLSDALEKGYITSELLVKLYLERIDAYDEQFNAIREINPHALEEAQKLDIERQKGNIRSPLHGIPILVKTNIDVFGIPTTAGAKSLEDNYPKSDAAVIKKLRDAGAIILGSTNMSEFAFQAIASKSSYGTVKNAFNPNYSPNGSSGGSAVAIATSFAAASLGTDTNSSVRMPAAAAGLVGLRPTLGLISNEGVIPYDLERDTVGILTKTVNDNALILDIIAENKEYKKKFQKNLNEIKVGVITGYVDGYPNEYGANSKTDPDISALTHEKLKLLSNNGVNLVFIDHLINSYYSNIASSTMTGISFCTGFNNYIKNTTGKIRSFKDLVYSNGHIYSISGYLSGCTNSWQNNLTNINNKKKIFEEHIKEVMNEYDVDVILYPTTKNKELKLNQSGSLNAPGSSLSPVIGYPSLTVPMGFIDGLPYGIEFFSTKYSEETLYNIASIFENLNNLEVSNSPLTPNLYTIPNYLEELKNLYEKNYSNKNLQSLIDETRKYFLMFNQNDDNSNEHNAKELINKFKTTKINTVELIPKNDNASQNLINIKIALIVVIAILTPIIITIYLELKKHFKKLKSKINKDRKKKYGKRNQKKNDKS